MGRSQGALVDAAASNKAKCDCDSGDLVATGAGRAVAIGRLAFRWALPVLVVERTSRIRAVMSQFDP